MGTENVQYTRKQLQLIDPDEIKPPNRVIRGKFYVVKEILADKRVIIAKKKIKGLIYYKIHWEGYDKPSDHTWEKRSELIKNKKIAELIKDYEKKGLKT